MTPLSLTPFSQLSFNFRFPTHSFLKFAFLVLCIYSLAVLYGRSKTFKKFVHFTVAMIIAIVGIGVCIYLWYNQHFFRRVMKVLYISAGMFVSFVVSIFCIVDLYLWVGRKISKICMLSLN